MTGRSPNARLFDSGFSLVEVLVAVFILALAATGVAQVLTLAAEANLAAAGRSMSVILASQKLEQLRALDWGFDQREEGWLAVSDLVSDLTRDPPSGGGTGLAASGSSALEQDVPGFVDYVGANGAWLGTGTEPVPGTAYVRRWSIGRFSATADDALVLQVRVIPLRRAHAAGGPSPPGSLPDEVWVVTVVTRKAR